MSNLSGKTSDSFKIKTMFKKVFRQESGKPNISNRAAPVSEARYKPTETEASPGIRQLNKDGFVIYNFPEDQRNDIYVSNPSDKAFFDEDEPILIRVNSDFDNEVGSEAAAPEAEYEDDPSIKDIRSCFVNANEMPKYGEIDLSEVIYKKKPAEAAPAAAPADELIIEESTVEEPELMTVDHEDDFTGVDGIDEVSVKLEPAAALTSDGAVVEPPVSQNIDYIDTPDIVEENERSSDVPAGLYSEGSEDNNVAVLEEQVPEVTGEFGGMPKEMAVTEAMAAPVQMALPMLPSAEIPKEIKAVESDSTKNEVIEINDKVADILHLTVPGLDEDYMLMASFPVDNDKDYPDDGLEGFDAKFKPAPRRAAAAVGFGTGRFSTIGSSLNFTF